MAYEKHFDEAKENIGNAICDALEEIGVFGTGESQAITPVDTGKLRRSMGHKTNNKDTVYIGTNMDYAPYVHEGTSRQKAQPFIKDAVMNNLDEIQNIIEKHLSKVK